MSEASVPRCGIAMVLAAACTDRAVLARLGGPFGDRVRTAAVTLSRAAESERRHLCASAFAAARTPVPAGIRGADPSWLEAGLADLPQRARVAVASASVEARDVWLARWACAEIPPLPAISPTRAMSIADVTGQPAGELVRWLAEIGADQLALALEAAGASIGTAAVIAALDPASAAVVHRAVARIGLPPRRGALGPTRAAIARCRLVLDGNALVRIGARTLAPHADPFIARQLAVRLPRSLGLAILEELATHAGTRPDQGPTWPALAAAC